jgi:hypothetical protein
MPMCLLVARIDELPCIDLLWLTRCTLVITSRAGEWDKYWINHVVNKTANVEG